jgi:hypothetical protein
MAMKQVEGATNSCSSTRRAVTNARLLNHDSLIVFGDGCDHPIQALPLPRLADVPKQTLLPTKGRRRPRDLPLLE